jgi:hypothetical protein
MNRTGGVMVSVLASNVVDRGFESRSGQINYLLSSVYRATHDNTWQVVERTINWASYILRLALLTMILNRLLYQFNVSQSNCNSKIELKHMVRDVSQ